MSVVLSLVRLWPFLSFFRFVGRRCQIVNAQRIRKKGEDEISLSLCLFVGGGKKKMRRERRRKKDRSTGGERERGK